MTNLDCALCGKLKILKEFLPATFTPSALNPRIFSARRYPDRIHFRLVKCTRCGLIFSTPIIDPKKIAGLYREGEYKFASQVPYLTKTYLGLFNSLKFKLASGNLSSKAKVLEIGCSSGFFLEGLFKLGYQNIFGVDPGVKSVGQAHPQIKVKIKVDFFAAKLFPGQKFDLIACFHTLDHAIDPNKLVQDSFNLLKKRGLALFVVHDTGALSARLLGENSPIFDIEHIYLFNKPTLKALFKNAGFTNIQVFDVINSYPLDYWWTMVPLPRVLKKWGKLFLKMSHLAFLPLPIPAGNIAIIAQK